MSDEKIVTLPVLPTQNSSDIYEVSENGSGSYKENRAQMLSYISTNVTPSATNILSGTLPSARLIGNYTGITQTGTLTSLSVTGNSNFSNLSISQLVGTDSSKNIQSVNLTGDVTTSNSFSTTLATVNSNIGTFGSSTQVPVFTVNGKGLITSATNTTISGTTPGGSAGGDLSGSYPNPTVLKINGNPLGSTTPTSGNILIGSGSSWNSQTLVSDGTLSSTGSLIVTKTNGVPFAASATTDTTNAGNISSGTIQSGRISGSYTGITQVGNLTTLSVVNTGIVNSSISSSTSGSFNAVFFDLNRGDQTNGSAQISYETAGLVNYDVGLFPNSPDFKIFDANNSTYIFDLSPGSGTSSKLKLSGSLSVGSLSLSQLVGTDGNYNLVSVNLTGDVTTSNSFSTTLATVNSNIGTFGSSTQVPVFTVNGKGLITGVTNTTISGTTPGGSAGGDLSGSYPNPTVANINGNTLGSTTPTNNNALVANGTNWSSQAIVNSITGTSNQVIASSSTGAITLSLPQSIASSSSPTFNSLTISNSVGNYPIIVFNRLNQSTDYSFIGFSNNNSGTWNVGLYANSDEYVFSDQINQVYQLKILPGAGTSGAVSIAGSVTTGNTITTPSLTIGTGTGLSGTNAALNLANSLNIGNFISVGAGGRNIGVQASGGSFFTNNLDYNQSTSNYQYSGNGSATGIIFQPSSNGSLGQLIYAPSGTAGNSINPSIALQWTNAGVVNLPGLNSVGVVQTDASGNLSTVSSATSYTPVLRDSAGNTFTMTTQTGYYYKIGAIYHVIIDIIWSSKGSAASGNNVQVTIPVNIGSSCPRVAASIGFSTGFGFTGNMLVAFGNVGTNFLSFDGVSNSGTYTNVTVSQLNNAGEIQLNLFYLNV